MYYGYNSADVVGYVEWECDLVCERCVEDVDNAEPIFAGSEWDYQPCCDNCGDELEGVTILEYDIDGGE